MRDLLDFCEAEQPWLRTAIETLAVLESPTGDKAAVDTCGREVARLMRELGGAVDVIAQPSAGDHLRGSFGSGPARVLLIGHFDTVWDVGTLATMPVEERDGRLHGPGVFDMKAGLSIALQAIRALQHAGWPDGLEVVCLWTSDEETGSETSRQIIEDEARNARAVLVFEPALPGGGLKTARKGVGQFGLRVTGVPAHAGIDPRAGASAIHALAALVRDVERLNDYERGTSVNVGVIHGGTRSNVVAETATAEIDVRVAHLSDAPVIEQAIRGLAVDDPRVRVEITGGINRPPFERTAGVAELFSLASEVARDLGFALEEGATGGASDGNFTSAAGVPTLDGLGAIGDGAHARHEHIELASLPRRAALAAGLLRLVGSGR